MQDLETEIDSDETQFPHFLDDIKGLYDGIDTLASSIFGSHVGSLFGSYWSILM